VKVDSDGRAGERKRPQDGPGRRSWLASLRAPESEELRRRKDAACRAALPLLSVGLGAILLLSLIFRLTGDLSFWAVVALMFTFLAGCGLVISGWRIRADQGSLSGCQQRTLAVIALTAVSLMLQMWAYESLVQTTYLELLPVAASATLLRMRWFGAALGIVWACWLLPFWTVGAQAGWFLAMLAGTLIAFVVHLMRIDAMRSLADALDLAEAAAIQDELTGLMNRRGLAVVGDELVALAARSRDPVACTFIDVDHLKRVNDEVGHDRGDELLVALASALRDVFREADVIARLGGDEFAVLTMGAGPAAEEVERRVSAALRRSLGDLDVDLGISAGRVIHMPWQDEDLSALLDRADQEMYRRRRMRRSTLDLSD